MAGKVLWHVTMFLDGFIAGPGDAMDWAFGHGRPGPVAEEVIEATGAILAGRRGYDLGIRTGSGPEGIYGGRWTGALFVLTHRPPDASGDSKITFLSDATENAVATARAAAEPQSLGIFGASIAMQCIEHGLLDEIVIHLVPVLLGEGVRFYDAPGLGQIPLERTLVSESGQITDLSFRILK
jgi:dihydrofolate reductase